LKRRRTLSVEKVRRAGILKRKMPDFLGPKSLRFLKAAAVRRIADKEREGNIEGETTSIWVRKRECPRDRKAHESRGPDLG
jgi:hypothetical protein